MISKKPFWLQDIILQLQNLVVISLTLQNRNSYIRLKITILKHPRFFWFKAKNLCQVETILPKCTKNFTSFVIISGRRKYVCLIVQICCRAALDYYVSFYNFGRKRCFELNIKKGSLQNHASHIILLIFAVRHYK